jgi:hypothetical protein
VRPRVRASTESGDQGTLESVELDATLDRTRLELLHGRQLGPLLFDLQRRSEAPAKWPPRRGRARKNETARKTREKIRARRAFRGPSGWW